MRKASRNASVGCCRRCRLSAAGTFRCACRRIRSDCRENRRRLQRLWWRTSGWPTNWSGRPRGGRGRSANAPPRRMAGCLGRMVASVNTLIGDLVRPTSETARVIGAVAKGDLAAEPWPWKSKAGLSKANFCASAKIVNTMVNQLRSFASEVTRVAREVGTEGKLGGQAKVRRRRHLEGPDRQRQLDGGQPDGPGAQHRRGHHRCGQRRPLQKDHRGRPRRDSATEGSHQHDGRSASLFASEVLASHARSEPRASSAARRWCRGWREPGKTSPTASTRWPET